MRNIRDSNSVYKSMHFEAKDNLKHSTLYTQKWKKKLEMKNLKESLKLFTRVIMFADS